MGIMNARELAEASSKDQKRLREIETIDFQQLLERDIDVLLTGNGFTLATSKIKWTLIDRESIYNVDIPNDIIEEIMEEYKNLVEQMITLSGEMIDALEEDKYKSGRILEYTASDFTFKRNGKSLSGDNTATIKSILPSIDMSWVYDFPEFKSTQGDIEKLDSVQPLIDDRIKIAYEEAKEKFLFNIEAVFTLRDFLGDFAEGDWSITIKKFEMLIKEVVWSKGLAVDESNIDEDLLDKLKLLKPKTVLTSNYDRLTEFIFGPTHYIHGNLWVGNKIDLDELKKDMEASEVKGLTEYYTEPVDLIEELMLHSGNYQEFAAKNKFAPSATFGSHVSKAKQLDQKKVSGFDNLFDHSNSTWLIYGNQFYNDIHIIMAMSDAKEIIFVLHETTKESFVQEIRDILDTVKITFIKSTEFNKKRD